MTRTQTYWINRSNERMDRYILDAERQADLISQSYYQASRYIEEEMAKAIKNLAVLSDDRTAIAALKRSPSKSLLRQLRSAVNTMAPGPEKDKALTLLASPSYQLRLRQLQTTIDNARRECERMYQMELNSTTEHLRNLYDDAFLHSVYDIDKGYNALHTFSMYPASRVDKLLKMPWSGAHYSDRIWGRTQNLADELRTQLITAFMTGATISETSAAIRERFAYASAYQARRLIRTETNYIANQAELDSYKRLGIEEYKYIATLDTRTSRLCQELDGQVFNSDDATAGKNFPPMHPNCRSTTIMYDAEEPLKERTARDENGNRITVPGNMKYKEWLEKYHPELVDKSQISGILKDIESDVSVNTKYYKGKLKYYDITDKRISSLDQMKLQSLSDTANQSLNRSCKNLLKYMSDEPTGTEGAFILDMFGNEIERCKSDKPYGGNVKIKDFSFAHIAIHNHPDGLIFSHKDIETFIKHENLKILGAVGNNGKSFFVEKSSSYDDIMFEDFVNETRKKYPKKWTPEEHIKFSEEVMEGAGNYGIIFYS